MDDLFKRNHFVNQDEDTDFGEKEEKEEEEEPEEKKLEEEDEDEPDEFLSPDSEDFDSGEESF